MKVLLVNTNRVKAPVPVIPIGLCYIASYCEKAGHKVKILDLCFSNNPEEDIKKVIQDFSPDIVGLGIRNLDDCSGNISSFFLNDIKISIVDPLKKNFKGPVVIGGAAVGISAEEILDYLDLKYAIRGDGEKSFLEFLENINNKKKLESIPGLVVYEDRNFNINNPPAYNVDLNHLSFVNPAKYINLAPYVLYNSPLLIQTKRGCSLRCTYCTYNKIEGYNYRLKDPELIADEIEALVKETGINRFEFVDSTFNIPLEHAKNVLKAIIKKNLRLKLSTLGLNPGAIDEELVWLLKKSGFFYVSVGIESASDTTLEGLGKNFTVADIKKASLLLHKAKLPVEWFLLLGAPGETEATLKETFKNLRKISSIWDFINIGFGIRVYKGAPIEEIVKKEKGNYPTDNFLKPFRYEPVNISLERIEYLTKIEYFKQHNFFLFTERKKPPKILRIFFNKFFPHLPLWKLYVVTRLIEKVFCFLLIKRIFFYFRRIKIVT